MDEVDKLEHWVVEYQQAGQDWVKAKLVADQLNEGQKNYLAALINKLEAESDEKISESKLERLARGSAEYVNYTSSMCKATSDMLSKRVRFDAFDKWFEAKRSGLSFEKEIIKKGIFNAGS